MGNVIDPQGDLCSCGQPLNDGVCPAYPDYANGEHPKTVKLPAIWVCPPDLNPDHVHEPEAERTMPWP